jgi:hypothetical protein
MRIAHFYGKLGNWLFNPGDSVKFDILLNRINSWVPEVFLAIINGTTLALSVGKVWPCYPNLKGGGSR